MNNFGRNLFGGYGGFGDLYIIISILVFIIALVGAIIYKRNRGGMVLVLKEFYLNERENVFLRIVGRVPGLSNAFRTMIGISPTTSFICDKQKLKFESASISGKETLNIPLVAITGVKTKLNKPVIFLVLGIVFIIFGIICTIALNDFSYVGWLISFAGILFIILYAIRKTMAFCVYNGGQNPVAWITLTKRNLIDGKKIDESDFESAADILNKAILNAHQSRYTDKTQSADDIDLSKISSINPNTVNTGDTWVCKKCEETNPSISSTCKGCGAYK